MRYHTFHRRLRQATQQVRTFLHRTGYLPADPADGPAERRCAWYPHQVDLPLYQPANVRGFFWGPMTEEEDEHGPIHWAEGEGGER